jgi:hypothetical protein
MLPKAYRFAGEMDEIAAFVRAGLDPGAAQIHAGLASAYARVDADIQAGGKGDVAVLNKFVEDAKRALAE